MIRSYQLGGEQVKHRAPARHAPRVRLLDFTSGPAGFERLAPFSFASEI
jgi:hypothetical protein